MIPDLGKYATDVLSAYAISILLIIALVGFSLRKATQTRKALEDAEKRARK